MWLLIICKHSNCMRTGWHRRGGEERLWDWLAPALLLKLTFSSPILLRAPNGLDQEGLCNQWRFVCVCVCVTKIYTQDSLLFPLCILIYSFGMHSELMWLLINHFWKVLHIIWMPDIRNRVLNILEEKRKELGFLSRRTFI